MINIVLIAAILITVFWGVNKTNSPRVSVKTTDSSPTTTITSENPASTVVRSTVTPSPMVVCTQEVKLCSDGSYVGRSGPKCQFKTCPVVTKPTPIISPVSKTSVKPQATGTIGTVKITSPLNEITVDAGATINVKVSTTGNINKVFVASSFGAEILETPPYEFSFKIPLEFLGQFDISVLGRNDAAIVADDKITVNVNTSAVVGPIRIFPEDNLPIIVGEQYQLSVSSTYSDGVRRDVTNLPGISFQSKDQSVATVDSKGLITARKVGTTNIIAQYYSKYSWEISVHVFMADGQ